MWKKLVNLVIYISLCIGVPRDHRNSTPNLYKQGTTPIDQGRSSRGRQNKRDSEEFSAALILGLRLQTKFSVEPKVRSKAETTDYFFLLRNPRAIIASPTPV